VQVSVANDPADALNVTDPVGVKPADPASLTVAVHWVDCPLAAHFTLVADGSALLAGPVAVNVPYC
jgi:hypothetical protein